MEAKQGRTETINPELIGPTGVLEAYLQYCAEYDVAQKLLVRVAQRTKASVRHIRGAMLAMNLAGLATGMSTMMRRRLGSKLQDVAAPASGQRPA